MKTDPLGQVAVRQLLDVSIHAVSTPECVEVCEYAIDTRRHLMIGVVNAAKLVKMRGDRLLRDSVRSANLIVADGMAVVSIPPASLAELPMNAQPTTIEFAMIFAIPPPKPATLPIKRQPVTTGLPLALDIPPPFVPAEFPVKMQCITVGLPPSLFIPAPLSKAWMALAYPAVMVNPSRTAVASTPLPVTTWKAFSPLFAKSGPSSRARSPLSAVRC